jgi:Mrp family chromosome partitioning ATPase
LTGAADVEVAVQHIDAHAISVITSGLDRAADAAVVSRNALGMVVDRLRARFQVVLFDAAPLLPYLESITLAQQLDGMVLVLRAENDKREVAQQTVQMLERAGARVLGAVLNRKPLHIPQWIYKLL